MTLDPATKRRISFVYFLQMIGTFMFIFLFVAAILQWRWRRRTVEGDVLYAHQQWQIRSVIFFVIGVVIAFAVPHKITQLCLAYGAMALLLGRSIYGNWKLRKEAALAQSFLSRTSE